MRWVLLLGWVAGTGCATLQPADIEAAGQRQQAARLLGWLQDDRSWVREEAALALAQLRTPESARALETVLGDGEERRWVRSAAARSLGALGDPASLPVLLGVAAAPATEAQLKVAAIEASCRVGGPDAVPALAPLSKDEDLLVAAVAERMVRNQCGL